MSVRTFVEGTYRHAMDAKERVFRAQDNLSLAFSQAAEIQNAREHRKMMRDLDRIAAQLTRARHALERVDNLTRELRREPAPDTWGVREDGSIGPGAREEEE
jgi:hypothetical protein